MSDRTDEQEMQVPVIRTGQAPGKLDKDEFARRYRAHFADPLFEGTDLEPILERAWEAYRDGHKAPRTRKAGPSFADPEYELSCDWLAAREAIQSAALRHADRARPCRILIVNGSPRNDRTCPGEMAKSFRLAKIAEEVITRAGAECDLLDLSLVTSEYGRVIYPCKGCVSTAMPLCHWPCSCYPHHSLGQVNDWMADIYPRWVAAHGILVVTPVHWNQVPGVLKLMMDRLVCADGGNPDPTLTGGKNAALAKKRELDGWHYPRHLKGRAFGVVVHADTEGAQAVRRALVDWMTAMELQQADGPAALDRFIGYYESYATSHEALDRDVAVQQEVRIVAQALLREAEQLRRTGPEDAGLPPAPRPK
ncbi:flavodoxin family protein [Tahibacter amnicola]|uniref:Flavodoxin family protein n=1 Tax=Tahibacter amnicola TaxID=2976241 RepID=A0ABY6BJJ0_9GAMM|nr:NAD(P)H-dependent oxidoreductase [Tahibacter amnicola]UXI70189.1 flavodoxin family protein [Tahibacter amnicola]